MAANNKISRRSFLISSIMMAGGLCVAGCGRFMNLDYLVLTDQEARTLDALADQIIPPDDYPGGSEAGVTYFIDYQLTAHLDRYLDFYRTGLAALNSSVHSQHGKDFYELDLEQQRQILKEMDEGLWDNGAGNAGWNDLRPSGFFHTVREHSMMGFYGDPKHGGNTGHISYEMLGLPVEQTGTKPGDSDG
jgi:gluconate 2-dehydrogenase gamma chain